MAMQKLPWITDVYRWSCLGNELVLRSRRNVAKPAASYSLTIKRGSTSRHFKIRPEVRPALASAIEAIKKNPNAANKFMLSDELLSLTCEPPRFVLGGAVEPRYIFITFKDLARFYEKFEKATRI
jgi:hypothetical protein